MGGCSCVGLFLCEDDYFKLSKDESQLSLENDGKVPNEHFSLFQLLNCTFYADEHFSVYRSGHLWGQN